MKSGTRSPKPKGTSPRAAGRRAAKAAAALPKNEAEIWLRILHPHQEMSPETARAILDISISEADIALLRELSAKARAGTLTPAEDELMNQYERAGSILGVIQSKARQVLKRKLERA